MLDVVGMLLVQDLQEIERVVQYTGRWENHLLLHNAVNALYDHLCLLDDMYDIAGVEFDVKKLRVYRHKIAAFIHSDPIAQRLGRNHQVVYSDVATCVHLIVKQLNLTP